MYTGVFSAAVTDKGQLALVLKVVHVRQKGTPADEPPTVRPQPAVTLATKDIVQVGEAAAIHLLSCAQPRHQRRFALQRAP